MDSKTNNHCKVMLMLKEMRKTYETYTEEQKASKLYKINLDVEEIVRMSLEIAKDPDKFRREAKKMVDIVISNENA